MTQLSDEGNPLYPVWIMKLDFTKLRGGIDGLPAFLLVAERRSFKAAAQELGISPSAVSQTVRALEARLGVALLQARRAASA